MAFRAIAACQRRLFHSAQVLAHDNPLGIPKRSRLPPPGSPGEPQIPRAARGLPVRKPIAGVEHIVAVASGKGGVGKSTTSVNLAVSLASIGYRTGLLDADLFGPSIPIMMNLSGEPRITDDGRLVPLVNYGVRCMSMGFLVGDNAPVVWRGLMVMKALEKLLRQVDWTGLDVLVIDMPPGTGDTQLTITQQIPLSGAIIVSTPQDVALSDAKRGAAMFSKVNVPVLGMVQNMSLYTCPNCGHTDHIFGHDGVRSTAKSMGIDILADVPLHADVVTTSDKGTPIVIAQPDGIHAKIYRDIAQRLVDRLKSKNNPEKTDKPSS